MTEIKINTNCCEKEMVELERIPGQGDAISTMWICPECGAYYRLDEDVLDEEELETYKKNYPKYFKRQNYDREY